MLSEKIKNLVSETDKLDELSAIIEESDALETQLSEAANKISELETTIAGLRDVNMKLFINQTATVEEELEEEKSADEIIDELLSEIM